MLPHPRRTTAPSPIRRPLPLLTCVVGPPTTSDSSLAARVALVTLESAGKARSPGTRAPTHQLLRSCLAPHAQHTRHVHAHSTQAVVPRRQRPELRNTVHVCQPTSYVTPFCHAPVLAERLRVLHRMPCCTTAQSTARYGTYRSSPWAWPPCCGPGRRGRTRRRWGCRWRTAERGRGQKCEQR